MDEYKEASSNFRLYADLRFKQLTLYASIIAALLIAYARADSVGLRSAIPWCGILTTVIFFVLEARATVYRRGFTRRAIALEPVLAFRQFRNTKLGGVWSSLWMILLFFAGVLVLWIHLIITTEKGAGLTPAPSVTFVSATTDAPASSSQPTRSRTPETTMR